MHSLAGKNALITGGSRGIGLAIARRFASEGAQCTLVGRDPKTLDAACASLPVSGAAAASLRHSFLDFEVQDQKRWDGALNEGKFDDVDILVNAAGITQNSLLFRTKEVDVQRIVDTNLLGTIAGCRTLIPKMMKRQTGCIINVSSLLALQGGRGASVYAASKAGIVALTRSLAWEVGRFGIRANVLLPGYIQTSMTQGMDEKNALSATIPLGRLGLAEEVADAAAFLATNSYAHNCTLNIDGGLSAA